MDLAKTTARRGEKLLSCGIWYGLYNPCYITVEIFEYIRDSIHLHVHSNVYRICLHRQIIASSILACLPHKKVHVLHIGSIGEVWKRVHLLFHIYSVAPFWQYVEPNMLKVRIDVKNNLSSWAKIFRYESVAIHIDLCVQTCVGFFLSQNRRIKAIESIYYGTFKPIWYLYEKCRWWMFRFAQHGIKSYLFILY